MDFPLKNKLIDTKIYGFMAGRRLDENFLSPLSLCDSLLSFNHKRKKNVRNVVSC
jgi:hypothetical protein